MRRYAFSALLLLILPALVFVVMSQAPAADVSTDTGQPASPTATPGDIYMPRIHRDHTPTPTNTPTPTPTATPAPEPVGTGIFHQISESYKVDDSTAFWLYFWGPEGRGNPADGSIYVKICIDQGDHAGTCVWSANGHNGGTGELVVWLSYDDAWESKGTVTLYPSEDGSRPDEDADPISRAFIFDMRDAGSTVGMEFQECTTASTSGECDPANWSVNSSVDLMEGELLSPEAFDAWIDSLRQQ